MDWCSGTCISKLSKKENWSGSGNFLTAHICCYNNRFLVWSRTSRTGLGRALRETATPARTYQFGELLKATGGRSPVHRWSPFEYMNDIRAYRDLWSRDQMTKNRRTGQRTDYSHHQNSSYTRVTTSVTIAVTHYWECRLPAHRLGWPVIEPYKCVVTPTRTACYWIPWCSAPL